MAGDSGALDLERLTLGLVFMICSFGLCAFCAWLFWQFAMEQVRYSERMQSNRELDEYMAVDRLSDELRTVAPGVKIPRYGPLATLHSLGKLSCCQPGAPPPPEGTEHMKLLGFEPTPIKSVGSLFGNAGRGKR